MENLEKTFGKNGDFENVSFLIGAYLKDNKWIWNNTGNPIGYTWTLQSRQPEEKNGQCLEFWKYKTYGLNQINCSKQLQFICQDITPDPNCKKNNGGSFNAPGHILLFASIVIGLLKTVMG